MLNFLSTKKRETLIRDCVGLQNIVYTKREDFFDNYFDKSTEFNRKTPAYLTIEYYNKKYDKVKELVKEAQAKGTTLDKIQENISVLTAIEDEVNRFSAYILPFIQKIDNEQGGIQTLIEGEKVKVNERITVLMNKEPKGATAIRVAKTTGVTELKTLSKRLAEIMQAEKIIKETKDEDLILIIEELSTFDSSNDNEILEVIGESVLL